MVGNGKKIIWLTRDASGSSEVQSLKSIGYDVISSTDFEQSSSISADAVFISGLPEEFLVVARWFTGKIIYRIPSANSLSDFLWRQRAFELIDLNPNCYFLVDSQQAFLNEHAWIREKVTVLPATSGSYPGEISRILSAPVLKNPLASLIRKTDQTVSGMTVYLLFHYRGEIVKFKNGDYLSAEGISRVMRRFVHAVLKTTDLNICVTCDGQNAVQTIGFFYSPEFRGRLTFLLRDREYFDSHRSLWRSICRRGRRLLGGLYRFKERVTMAIDLRFIPIWLLRLIDQLPISLYALGVNQQHVGFINHDSSVHSVLVPHYLPFPEAVNLEKPIYLYLPDFIPGFFPDNYHALYDHINMLIGRTIASKATCVMTNSLFTKDYLPTTQLRVDREKIRMVPIPLLMGPSVRSGSDLDHLAQPVPYLFYPTQNRINKRLDFALTVFAKVRERWPQLRLVLTCSIDDIPAVAEVYHRLNLSGAIDFHRQLTDGQLQALYANASGLLFSSVFEGNFPPQIFEALVNRTPVVAGDIPMITEVLGQAASLMRLAKALDVDDFVEKLHDALAAPDQLKDSQSRALQVLLNKADDKPFYEAVSRLYSHL